MKKLKLGISACLLGERVRYDGKDALDSYLIDLFSSHFQLIPYCPESEAGLGVPREPMRLVGDRQSPRLVVTKTGKDETKRIITWARKKLKELERENLVGLILKSKSPCCGVRGVNVYQGRGRPLSQGKGLFAKFFQEHFPLIPVEEDRKLHQIDERENFISRIFIFSEWRKLLRQRKDFKLLVDFHTRLKFCLFAHSPKYGYEMGKLVCQGHLYPQDELFWRYSQLLVKTLSMKTTIKKHINVLHQLMGFLKRDLQPDEKRELLEAISSYREGNAPLIIPITLLNHYARKYNQSYLRKQYYLHPHPLQLKLQNHA